MCRSPQSSLQVLLVLVLLTSCNRLQPTVPCAMCLQNHLLLAPCIYAAFFIQDFDIQPIDMGYDDGRERLLLWLPVICKHVITPESPLATWSTPEGVMADADSTIVIWVRLQLCLCWG